MLCSDATIQSRALKRYLGAIPPFQTTVRGVSHPSFKARPCGIPQLHLRRTGAGTRPERLRRRERSRQEQPARGRVPTRNRKVTQGVERPRTRQLGHRTIGRPCSGARSGPTARLDGPGPTGHRGVAALRTRPNIVPEIAQGKRHRAHRRRICGRHQHSLLPG